MVVICTLIAGFNLSRYFHFLSFFAVTVSLLSAGKSSCVYVLGFWTHTFSLLSFEACAISIPSSTSLHFTSPFIVFTVMGVLRPCKPKAPKFISHKGSLTTIIEQCIRFNNTIREFMRYKYRCYTHTNNIRFSVSYCTINISF